MYTIGEMGKKFGISRSTLIYYDKIGLLSPSLRTSSNYRVYSGDDFKRMEKIDKYKSAGVKLKDILRILDSEDSIIVPALEKRIDEINSEMKSLRSQQRRLTELITKSSESGDLKTLDKDGWIKILKASGMDENDLTRWHVEFEKASPSAHQEFLESLGMKDCEIKAVKEASRKDILNKG